MFDDPNYTKPRVGGAVGKGLQSLVDAYNTSKQVQNQTRQVEQTNPNRPIAPRDLIGLLLEDYKQHNLNQQLAAVTNPGQAPTPYNPQTLLQGLQTILGNGAGPSKAPGGQPTPPIMPSAQPSIQIPAGSGPGGPQFINPASQGPVPMPAPPGAGGGGSAPVPMPSPSGAPPAQVSRSGFPLQALVDEMRKRGLVT